MSDWKSYLKADPTEWLLEKGNPSVRYFTLIDILGESPDDKNVINAKKEIMKTGPVPVILSKRVNGLWGDPDRYYLDKYQGTSWQLIILAELGADNGHNELKTACDFILDHAQDRESYGFSIHTSARGGGRHSEVIPCLTGNMVWALIKIGYGDDTRVQNALKWITTYQRFDDGTDKPARGWPYDRSEACWGRHTCHMGVVKALKALSAVPKKKRTPAMRKAMDQGAEYMLKHFIFKQSHTPSRISKPGWLKFGFPLMYQTDALEIASILTDEECRDKRLQETMALIQSKQDARGRWNLENTFNGKWIADIEVKGKPSKWITLRALKSVKKYYE
jgi:hypothetical protein